MEGYSENVVIITIGRGPPVCIPVLVTCFPASSQNSHQPDLLEISMALIQHLP